MLPRFLKLALIVTVASAVSAQPGSPFLGGAWSGNVTASSASVVVRLAAPGARVRLQVGTTATLSPAVFSLPATAAATSGNSVKLSIQGLKPDTDYFYGIELGGTLRAEAASRGRFHTFPLGAASFRLAFASCSDYRHLNQTAFDALVAERPLLFIHMGDLHYSDLNSTVVDDYRTAYDNVLSQPNASALYRNVPIAYMWDDHDFTGNDSDGTAIGRDAARQVYRERVPHYSIPDSAGGAISQSFTIGRVRVIMTDLRSMSDAASTRESEAKTRLGAAQKAWFKQELLDARDAGWPLILWVCTAPWIESPQLGSDGWGGYATERNELATFLRDNHINNLAILAGDMHALAYDDGTHSDYATGGGAPLPVLHAAALTAEGEVKGGPYTAGPFPGSQQYGILEIYDTGGPGITARFLGMRVGEGAKLTYTFGATAAATASDPALVNISTLASVSAGNDVLSCGFVIGGRSPRNILVRAAGPALAQFGVTDFVSRPTLTVFQKDGKVIASNDGWAPSDDAASRLVAAFDRAGAFHFPDTSSRDSALLLTLTPGSYTVQVRSGTTIAGRALVEVYDVTQ